MRLKRILLALAVLLVPAAAFAQASLTGVVRDTSGAVLPGVTVEATSPVLIEKARSTVTDTNGRFQIVDLRPGTYRVTYTLSGFTTAVRETVQVSGTAIITADGELRVGAVQETITVSGEAPTVNLQTTTRQAVMDQEIVSAIPTSRTPFSVGVLIPGVKKGFITGQDVGGSVVQGVASLEANGGRTFDQRMMVNGVALSSMIAGGWGGGAVPNASGTAEFAIDVSAVDAQAATGGVRINFIPRTGGNRFGGTVFTSYAGENFASDNYTGTEVQTARGLAAPGTVKANGDFNPGFGGPLKKDKIWFFASARSLFADNYVANMFYNENANKPDRFDYVRSARQAVLHQEQKIAQGNVTWQVNQKNRLGVTADFETSCSCVSGTSTNTSAEAGSDFRFPLQRFITVDWNSPISSKVLFEASAIHRVERWGGMEPRNGKLGNIDSLVPGMISVNDTFNPVTGGALTYRAAAQFNNSWNSNLHYRAAVSYITGSHSFKVGFNNAFGHHENTTYTSPVPPYSYGFNAGLPASITYRIAPRTVESDVDQDLGLFVQDRWTTGRWTLSGGIRFDSFKNSFPQQGIVGTFFGKSLNVMFPEKDNVSWQDITPKLGATWDVFGKGRTAIKVTLNKYLEGLGTTGGVSDGPNPINRLNTQTNRNWSDSTFGAGDPRTGNFVPDCDLNNFDANGECAVLTNAATFGTLIPGTTYDPELLTGWGKRGFNWEFTTSIQHEIVPRVSAEVQYARRWYGNFRVNDDLNITPGDYERLTFKAPLDSRLPGGGGYDVTFLDQTPAAQARAENIFVTSAKPYGSQIEHFDGINLSINARMKNGLLAQGGMGTGRQLTDDCDIVDDLPETLNQFFGSNARGAFFFPARPVDQCRQNMGWRTQFQGLAAYTLPKVDVQISATFQNLPGGRVSGNASISTLPFFGPNVLVVQLPRPTTGPFQVVNIVNAGELFIERLNQIDFRASKIFRLGSTKTALNFDFYNVTNSNSVTGFGGGENGTYSPVSPRPAGQWRDVTGIMGARLFKFSVQFDF